MFGVDQRVGDFAQLSPARPRQVPTAVVPTLIYGRQDWPKHWALSAAIAVGAGMQLSEAAGEWKELADSLARQSRFAIADPSGFSMADLAADRAGFRTARGAWQAGRCGAHGHGARSRDSRAAASGGAGAARGHAQQRELRQALRRGRGPAVQAKGAGDRRDASTPKACIRVASRDAAFRAAHAPQALRRNCQPQADPRLHRLVRPAGWQARNRPGVRPVGPGQDRPQAPAQGHGRRRADRCVARTRLPPGGRCAEGDGASVQSIDDGGTPGRCRSNGMRKTRRRGCG